MADVFISYAHEDQDFVRELHEALEKLNRDTWIDWKDIPRTAKWIDEVYSGIESADAVAFVISPDSVASEFCIVELNHAVEHNKRLVPILHRDVDDESVPPDLSSHKYVFFGKTDDFDRAFEDLIEALDADLDWRHEHTWLEMRAIEWNNKGRDSSCALRGRDLKEAEAWLERAAEKEPKPTDLQRQYITSSREAARFQRAILGAVAFVVIVIAILASVAWWQWGEAEEQRSEAEEQKGIALGGQLASQAELVSNQGEDGLLPDSVLLAMEAKQRLPSKANASSLEADQVLRGGLALLRRPGVSLTLEDKVNGVAFSPDGKHLATASDDETARVWDTESGDEVGRMDHGDKVKEVAFSPDGKDLVTVSDDKTARIWDLSSEVERMALEGKVNGVAFSPDGKHLATASKDRTARIWDLSSEDEVTPPMTHADKVNGVAFSPDGKHLATVSDDKTTHVWDAESGDEVTPRRMTREKPVHKVAFSPDGKYLATAGREKSARLWDVDSGDNVADISHEDTVNGAAFSPDGKYLATASNDKTARVQLWQPEGLIEEVCAYLTRNLTKEEWKQHAGDELYPKTCPNLPVPEE